MADREKLIELLGLAEDAYLDAMCEEESAERRVALAKNAYAFYADHLIANGVTVQKHGRWVLKERAHYFKCSLCKEPIAYKFGYADSRRHYNYCPNCGAKMDEKGDNE